MSLTFPNYYELEKSPNLTDIQKDILQSMLCDKFTIMNNNHELNKEIIKKNVKIINTVTNFYKSKEYVTFNLYVNFFDFTFCLAVNAYFNNIGQYTQWLSYYEGDSRYPEIMNILNINHFNDANSHLEFSLKDDALNEVYTIIKLNDVKLPDYPKKRLKLKYYFNKNHTVHCKSFETVNYSVNGAGTSSYSIEGFEKVASEILFLKFLRHITNEQEHTDIDLINYNTFNFDDANWVKKAHATFFRLLTGDKRVAFLDYMKMIDMLTI